MSDFDKTRNGLADGLLDDDDDTFDDEETIERRQHDYLWGKYLFEKYTNKGTTPVTPEVAATLPYRDIECIMLYPTPEEFDFLTDDVVHTTISVCSNELAIRDERIEEASRASYR